MRQGSNTNLRRRPLAAFRQSSQCGLALITVLWLISLLILLAAIVLSVTRNRVKVAQRAFETLYAESVLDSAIRLRLAELAFPIEGRLANRGTSTSVALFGFSANVSIELEAGRIDLNVADEDLLTAFFAGNGTEEKEARSFAARIIDWRDVDDSAGPDGAEEVSYRSAGLSYGPRNGPFEAPDEVRQVLGLSDLSEQLLDGLTVYTHAPPIATSETRPSVRQALQWADAKRLGGRRWLPEFSTSGSTARELRFKMDDEVSLIGQVLRVQACTTSGDQSWCRIAVARLTGNANVPIQIFLWRSALM